MKLFQSLVTLLTFDKFIKMLYFFNKIQLFCLIEKQPNYKQLSREVS